jgi:hypothetical protein
MVNSWSSFIFIKFHEFSFFLESFDLKFLDHFFLEFYLIINVLFMRHVLSDIRLSIFNLILTLIFIQLIVTNIQLSPSFDIEKQKLELSHGSINHFFKEFNRIRE